METNDQPTVNDPGFWERLYENGGDGWELGRPAPPLTAYLEKSPPPLGKVAVLGCGRGHDCRLFARLGYRVWGFDFAHQAIQTGQARAPEEGLQIVFEQRDIFDLVNDYRGFFDGIWEYTCFCAIDPARRKEYAELVREILRPEGWLLACFYPLKEGTEGPPFPTSEAEIRHLFTPDFVFLESYTPAESVERRQGLEWMVMARLRAPHATTPWKSSRRSAP